MGEYNPHRGYGLVIYTDDFQGEAHRFYVYNFMGWRVPTSVELLSNQLSSNSAKMITFGTLVDAIKGGLTRVLDGRTPSGAGIRISALNGEPRKWLDPPYSPALQIRATPENWMIIIADMVFHCKSQTNMTNW